MKNLVPLFICLLLAVPAPARTIIVDDDGPADFNNIQAAIDDSNDGDIVMVQPGTYTGPGNRDIDCMGKAITVRSVNPSDSTVVSATVIDCQGKEDEPHRGFRFSSGEGHDSVVAGLTIMDGYGPDESGYTYPVSVGGAIYCVASNPMIVLCRIVDNHASYKGGGIYCEQSSPMLVSCEFSHNSAAYGGAIYNRYGSNPTIVNCTFTRNSTAYPGMGFGGAIANTNASSPSITLCSFIQNTAESNGGAIRNEDHGTNPTIENCVFRSNHAVANGGSVFSSYGSSPEIANCVFVQNTAGDIGGAIANGERSSPAIDNCTFSGNSAATSGHVLGNYDGGDSILSNCILWDNTSYTSQIVLEDSASVSLSYCDIQGGTAAIKGQSFRFGQGNIDTNPLFESDGYHLRYGSPCIDAGDPNGDYEGQYDIDRQCRVMGGRADIGADEYGIESPALLYVHPARIDLTATVGEPNSSSETIFIYNLSSSALDWGIIEDCCWLKVSQTSGTLTSGVAKIDVSADTRGIQQGYYTCELVVSDGDHNRSQMTIHVTLVVHTKGMLHVPCEFATIQAGIDAAHDGDTVVVADGTYTGNGNRNIDFGGKRITVRSEHGPEGCIIDCERVAWGFYFHSHEDANSVLGGFTVANGYVSGSGGAIYCQDSSPTLMNCRFIDNVAYHGGALAIKDGSPHLLCCTFSRNRALMYGGAIENYHSAPTLTGCTFSLNSSGQYGGAIFDYECSPAFIRCIFGGNSAGMDGGAVYEHASSPTVINCMFVGNSAGEDGGAVQVWNESEPILSNCTFYGNRAGGRGGGLCSRRRSNPLLINCIMHGNEAEHGNTIGLILYSWAGNVYTSQVTVSYSDIEGGYEGIFRETGCQANWGIGNLDDDPCFADSGSGDYHLKSQAGRWDPNTETWVIDHVTSPCIDAGNPMTLVGHESFPNGGTVNMGAYGGTIEASKSYFDEPVCETIVAGDINGDCKVNFLDLRLMANHWIEDNPPLPLPGRATNPDPHDGATNVSVRANLRWRAGLGATSHNLYFGPNSPPPFIHNQIDTAFDPGRMDECARYFWRVDEINAYGRTTGTVWTFTTSAGGKVPPWVCFPSDTPVWIDGKRVQISKVTPGQSLRTFEAIFVSGSASEPKVESIDEHAGTFECYDIILESGNQISVVGSHLFRLSSEQWVPVQNLTAGSILKSLKGPLAVRTITKRATPYTGKVYNLKIKDSDRYFVGKDGIVVRDY